MESKHYLLRDHGMIMFSSSSEKDELFWLSFRSGGHMDWIYYIEISKPEFFDVWKGNLEIRDLYGNYSHIRMSPEESKKIES